MNKITFWLLLFVEYLCGWFVLFVWPLPLVLIGGNIVFVKLGYKKFAEWFEPQEAIPFAVENAILAVTGVELVLFQALSIAISYSI